LLESAESEHLTVRSFSKNF